jgi:holo-[acyl-carrier protein] synthase
MIVGVGLDLVELERVERALARWGERLVGKLMDGDEAARLPSPPAARVEAVARAIAAKEAGSKALGTGWSQGVRWRDVVLEPGPPARVLLRARAADTAAALGSRGGSELRFEVREGLVLAEVRLLS